MSREIKAKYWYCFFVQACPVCGHETVYRERRYDVKPVNPYFYQEAYDNCLEWEP